MQTFSRITEVKVLFVCECVQPSVICVWMRQHPSCHPDFTRSHTTHNCGAEYFNTTHKALRPTEHSKPFHTWLIWRIPVFTTVKMPGDTNISRKSSLLMLIVVKTEASKSITDIQNCFQLIKSAKRLQNKHMNLNSAFYYQITVSYKINQYQVRIYMQIIYY